MLAEVESGDVISSMLLVKAVLALLAVCLFIYYKLYWDRAKRHLQVHFFYARWHVVRHATALGLAAVGFAIGFSLEFFGTQLGLSTNMARFSSSVFEIASLFSILYVFFTLALEDVPHFQHIYETAKRKKHHAAQQEPQRARAKPRGMKR